uniref:Uncharacterized protein n=1 Tax=Anguilla anguilla TaxID=7936 RepID=A0A0E9TB76_ANGAN
MLKEIKCSSRCPTRQSNLRSLSYKLHTVGSADKCGQNVLVVTL